MGNKQTPTIRFARFIGGWERLKADEIFYSVSEKNHSNLPLLSASQKKGMVYREEIGIDIKYDEKSTKNYKRVLPGQFVIHLRSFQGGFAFSNIEGITSPAYTVLDFKNNEKYYSLFWRYVLSSNIFIKRLETVTYGIRDGRSISFSDFSTLKFQVPSLNEQVEIGGFFNKVDEVISLHQQELTTLQQTKQGFLQKMFPKEGESVPEVRFPGFTDAWEQRKLSELGKVTTGKAFSSTDFNGDGEYLVITNKDISDSKRSQNTVTDRINTSDDKLISQYKLSGENILVTMDGVNLGKTGMYSNDKALLAQRVGRIQSDQIEFVYQVTSNPDFLSMMRTLSVGNAIKHISLKQIADYTSFVPTNKEEQAKIGWFFANLDETITLHQRELDALQETKKAFLQKMFV